MADPDPRITPPTRAERFSDFLARAMPPYGKRFQDRIESPVMDLLLGIWEARDRAYKDLAAFRSEADSHTGNGPGAGGRSKEAVQVAEEAMTAFEEKALGRWTVLVETISPEDRPSYRPSPETIRRAVAEDGRKVPVSEHLKEFRDALKGARNLLASATPEGSDARTTRAHAPLKDQPRKAAPGRAGRRAGVGAAARRAERASRTSRASNAPSPRKASGRGA